MSIADQYDTQTVANTERSIPARVWLRGPPSDPDSFRVPVGGEQGAYVQMVKDHDAAPTDVVRTGAADFPTRAFDVNWLERVRENRSTDTFGVLEPCVFEMYDATADEYIATLYGYITNVGGAGKNIGAKLAVRGPSFLLNAIPANVTFQQGATARTVLEYVRDTFIENQPLFRGMTIPQVDAPDDVDVDGLLDPADAIVESVARLLNKEKGLEAEKRFRPNRDTLADVIEWVRQTTGSRIWIEPTPKEGGIADLTLIATAEPSVGIRDARHLGGSVPVAETATIPNDRGINTVTLVGETGFDIEALGDTDISIPYTGDTYPVATATAPNLVDAQGGRVRVREESDANTAAVIQEEARSRLKDILDSVAVDEELITAFRPSLRPYMGLRTAVDAAEARADDASIITHEIEAVGHHAYYSETEGVVAKTSASVGRYAQMTDIEVETRIESL